MYLRTRVTHTLCLALYYVSFPHTILLMPHTIYASVGTLPKEPCTHVCVRDDKIHYAHIAVSYLSYKYAFVIVKDCNQ